LQWESLDAAAVDGNWSDDPAEYMRQLEQRVQEHLPHVLARLDNNRQSPLLIERRIGRGRVLLFSSGLLSPWNTLPQTNAVVMFDRILRSMIESTLPERNFESAEGIIVPLPAADQQTAVTLSRPNEGAAPEPLNVGFVRRNLLGVDIPDALQRGIYRLLISDRGTAAGEPDADARPGLEIDVAVNGPAAESNWQPLTRAEFETEAATDKLAWVGASQEISLAGAQLRARDAWWWIILAVMILLMVETMLLAAPTISRRSTPERQNALP
jgi:hypothetical protein